MLIVRGVNLFPTQIEEQVLKCSGLAPHFQIELTRPGRMDELLVRVEARNGVDAAAQGELLGRLIKDVTGVSARTEIVAAGVIPRSAGKAVRVVDNRPKEGAI
jgi:phenylacetate-CoA ligase